ncbi:hypothetical protein Sme01_10210 [Sphaerisporangium melleum]|uniref:Uncharacterized protein n=1 Tax=Sphaerisporangium melleum TaxID=321316 RepID=A0A917VEM9_9ACTN|nr:hypothetical protein GCM10007964_07400 [Sphaerisporangium melleum]GII68545.1 hypothetical protein Sme01_10210 [Sphaerisporangium melleum]
MAARLAWYSAPAVSSRLSIAPTAPPLPVAVTAPAASPRGTAHLGSERSTPGRRTGAPGSIMPTGGAQPQWDQALFQVVVPYVPPQITQTLPAASRTGPA